MVTFQVKDSRRHRGLMRSRNTRLPGLGLLGRMRLAGVSIRVDRQAHSPAPVVHTTAASTASTHTTGCTLNWRAGILYMMLKALAITAGMRVHPTASPISPPRRLAQKA